MTIEKSTTEKKVIGNIVGYHGIKGEIKLYPLFDDVADLEDVEEIFINEKKYILENYHMHKTNLLIKLKDVDDRTAAEKIKGLVEAEINIELEDNEFFIEDLMGLKVYDQESRYVGLVIDFSDKAACHIIIELDKSYDSKRDLIMPFVEEYIMEVDCESGSMKINLTDDLLDLTK